MPGYYFSGEYGTETWDDYFGRETEHAEQPTAADPFAHHTQSQLDAVTAGDQPLLVLAGAGTGKTRVLTSRIIHRLQQGDLKPAHILALTFTKKAASEMTRRLEASIGLNARNMDIGTFHSIFARAIRSLDGAGGPDRIRPDFTLVDDDDMKEMIKLSARSISPAYEESLLAQNKISDILSAFSKYHSSKYPGEPAYEIPTSIQSFDKLLTAYRTLKTKHNVLDYDDVLIGFETLLDNPQIRMIFQRRWRMILVDEYQDTDRCQESIIQKISSRHRNITCVGDDDQSIYSWRNAKVSNILNFGERWIEGRIIRLEENFRSTAKILETANNIICRNTFRHGKILRATRESGSDVSYTSHANPFEEARAVANGIKQDIANGIPLREIAILCRVAAGLQEIQRQLVTDGIRYTMHAGSSVAGKIETKLIAAWIRMIVNPKDQAAFLYAFGYESRSLGKVAMSKVNEDARVTDSTIESVIRQQYRDRTKEKHKPLFEFLDNITELRTVARLGETPQAIIEEIIERCNIKTAIEKEKLNAEKAKTKDEAERYRRSAESREQNIAVMVEHAAMAESLIDLAANIILSNEKTSDDGEAAWLGTIHAAKSLEWKSVYLPAFETGIIPSPRCATDSGSADYAEERNLAYVAITRAKDKLAVSWTARRTIYGTQESGSASEFVTQMKEPNQQTN